LSAFLNQLYRLRLPCFEADWCCGVGVVVCAQRLHHGDGCVELVEESDSAYASEDSLRGFGDV